MNTKLISTNYRNIKFFNDVFTFEVETKKADVSLSHLIEKYAKMVAKGFINSFCVLENSSNMIVLEVTANIDRLTFLDAEKLNIEIGNIKD